MKHFTRITLIAGAFICLAFSSIAQKKLVQADLAFDNRQYYNAVELYKQAYTAVKKAEMKAKVLYRTAYAYHEINDMKSAETYYQKALSAFRWKKPLLPFPEVYKSDIHFLCLFQGLYLLF